jgi:hypothetical protein
VACLPVHISLAGLCDSEAVHTANPRQQGDRCTLDSPSWRHAHLLLQHQDAHIASALLLLLPLPDCSQPAMSQLIRPATCHMPAQLPTAQPSSCNSNHAVPAHAALTAAMCYSGQLLLLLLLLSGGHGLLVCWDRGPCDHAC